MSENAPSEAEQHEAPAIESKPAAAPVDEENAKVPKINWVSASLRFAALFFAFLAIAWWAYRSDFQVRYKGTPFQDSHYAGGPQKIPGRVECAYYDRGGEGVAYHDADAINQGSGKLNPADGKYLNEFRMTEGVDTSYTKFHDKDVQIDDSPFNLVTPPENQLYVGWTQPGEWFNLTVFVAHPADYAADLLYTSHGGGSIAFDVDGKPATGPVAIATTANAADPIDWRQWHHWNLAPGLVKLHLPGGKHVITVHIATGGNMNLAYFDFKKAQ
jgi:hypothetical protein